MGANTSVPFYTNEGQIEEETCPISDDGNITFIDITQYSQFGQKKQPTELLLNGWYYYGTLAQLIVAIKELFPGYCSCKVFSLSAITQIETEDAFVEVKKDRTHRIMVLLTHYQPATEREIHTASNEAKAEKSSV
jgi:hypothetical protein